MKTKQTLLLLLSVFVISASFGAPSKPKAAAETDHSELFAKGTEKLFKSQFAAAEKDLRAAIEDNEKHAEAHNNLAFVLRKQGADHYEAALKHYNRAIELDGKLAEAYMYRGVLHVAMAQPELALQDHAQLLKLGEANLAGELEWVIENGKEKEPAQFFGVVKADKS